MLTSKQLAIFNFIAKYIHENQVAPTLTSIAKGCGLNSNFEAYRYVERICRAGYLRKHKHQTQGIEILKYPLSATVPSTETKITYTQADAVIRAAYARGYKDGRREVLGKPDAIEEFSAKSNYARGYSQGLAKGKLTVPKSHAEAFERGVRQGREEGRRERSAEIRLLTKERESIL